MEIVEVEEQVAARRVENVLHERRLVAVAAGRVDQRCDVLEERRGADDGAGAGDVARRPLDRGRAPRRGREVADLDPASAHEREVLGPELGFRELDDAGEGVEALLIDGCGRREAERAPWRTTGT